MKLRYEGIKRWYGQRAALDLGHGQIEDGRISALIGPQGAGKSTLLNIIAGLERPDAGRMMYGYISDEGHQLFCGTVPKEKIALPFRQPCPAHETLRTYIAQPLKRRGASPEHIEKRTEALMAELGLAPQAKQRGWHLSDDEVQRAAFARALSPSPELLLLDLRDAGMSHATMGDLERLVKKENAERAMMVILISDDLAQVRRLADEVFFMQRGKVLEHGPTLELLSHPTGPETRAFIDARTSAQTPQDTGSR
jgi:ABC-type multidrug transport system ATPase subunit